MRRRASDNRVASAVTPGAPLLSIRNLRKSFGANLVLDDVSLESGRASAWC